MRWIKKQNASATQQNVECYCFVCLASKMEQNNCQSNVGPILPWGCWDSTEIYLSKMNDENEKRKTNTICNKRARTNKILWDCTDTMHTNVEPHTLHPVRRALCCIEYTVNMMLQWGLMFADPGKKCARFPLDGFDGHRMISEKFKRFLLLLLLNLCEFEDRK